MSKVVVLGFVTSLVCACGTDSAEVDSPLTSAGSPQQSATYQLQPESGGTVATIPTTTLNTATTIASRAPAQGGSASGGGTTYFPATSAPVTAPTTGGTPAATAGAPNSAGSSNVLAAAGTNSSKSLQFGGTSSIGGSSSTTAHAGSLSATSISCDPHVYTYIPCQARNSKNGCESQPCDKTICVINSYTTQDPGSCGTVEDCDLHNGKIISSNLCLYN